MKKYFIAWFITTPYLIMGQDSTQLSYTLSDCIELALKNNLDVQQSSLQSSIAQINLWQNKENLLPTINAGFVCGINEGRNIDPYTNTYINQQVNFANPDLSASLSVFNGFAKNSLIQQASFLYKGAKEKEQQAKDNTSIAVVLAYLQVLTNVDLLKLNNKQRDVTLKQLERLESLYQKGGVAPSVYFDLKGQLATDELMVLTIKSMLESSKLAIAQLLNIYYDKRLQFQPIETNTEMSKFSSTPEQIYLLAEKNLSMIKAVDFTVKGYEMRIRYARSGYYPSIYLRAGLTSNFSSVAYDNQQRPISFQDQLFNNVGKSMSLSMSVPIFNNIKTKNAVSIAKLNYREMQLLSETSRKHLQQLIERTYFDLMAVKERCNVLQDQVNSFSESFRIADARFTLGLINSTDYIIAKNNLDKASINLLIGNYEFTLRKKLLDFYSGKTIDR